MKIKKNTVVAFEYTLKDKDGNVIDTSVGREALQYLQGAGNIIPGLEKEMEGLSVGDKKHVEVAPEEGYGVSDPALVIEVPRSAIQVPGEIELGMRFHAQDANGGIHAFSVIGVTDEKIKLDGNHPLAGTRLFFDVEIKSVREATEEEIAMKHPAGSGCSCGGDCECDGEGGCGGDCGCH